MADLIHMTYGSTGAADSNALGMRPMQARAYEARSAQYLLLKAPPASGKSRALMFIALDKLKTKSVKKTIVAVPETSIGGSFKNTKLTDQGFHTDWEVHPRWNLCSSKEETSRVNAQKVRSFEAFMSSTAEVLVCTHATFRFAFESIVAARDIEAFDECLIAIDEFHHVAVDAGNRLGEILRKLLSRGRAQIMAMTGSYFRGDSVPVLHPEDEARFQSITYSYYEQIESYRHLKSLSIAYSFYKGRYITALPNILNTDQKTIIHIPHRGSAEAYDEKSNEVGAIMSTIGEHIGREPVTGFDLVRRHSDNKVIKIADLVDDGPGRDAIKAALQEDRVHPSGIRDDVADRDKVDIIIALGMAKEGFDWVWCEHAVAIGYRNSLTEMVQIIGRTTRDASGKAHAQFTNLVAEPLIEASATVDAVNDVLKAISGALLMEQVLAPNFKFYRRGSHDVDKKIFVGNDGRINVGIGGLLEPPTPRARAIVENDMQDLVAKACQKLDRRVISEHVHPEFATQVVLTEIIEATYEELTSEETEAVRQDLATRMNLLGMAKRHAQSSTEDVIPHEQCLGRDASDSSNDARPNVSLLNMVKRFINVQDISIDLVDAVNPFREGFRVASRVLNTPVLKTIQDAMITQRSLMTESEALALWPRVKRFRAQEGREPHPHAVDPLEKRLAEALAYIRNKKAERFRSEP